MAGSDVSPRGSGSLSVLKTILLFLRSHDLPLAAEALKNEVETSGASLAAVPAASVALRRCKCSRNIANQTEPERNLNGLLEGTFEAEPQQLKDDDVHVVYVCDHQNPNIRADADGPKSDFCRLKNEFRVLQREHHRLIAVTSELTNTIQMNVVSQTENISAALEHCRTIHPGLFTNPMGGKSSPALTKSHETTPSPVDVPLNLETLESGTPLTPETVRKVLDTVFDRIFAPEPSRSVPSAPLRRGDVRKIVDDVLDDIEASPVRADGSGEGGTTPDGRLFQIDYAKVKRDLVHSNSQRKVKILQALRWRVTKSDVTERQRTMQMFAEHDVFDLHRDVCVLERLMAEDADRRVQESACRLINAMASLRQGRDYLTADDKILQGTLLKMARNLRTISSSVVRDMLVASVQKLSIRKQCRAPIIRDGLLELLVDYLDDFYEALPRYCLEYATALLMNLCLVDEAKARAVKMSKKVVATLKKFLDGDKTYCLPYVNAIMFSLLERPELVEEALHQDLDKTVVRLIRTTTNDNDRKQLDVIVKCRLLGQQNLPVEAAEPEPGEEVDLLEAELDEDDVETSAPRGEDFLEEYRSQKLQPGWPSSARTFSEETKQFHHKPSSERGIFEASPPKTFDNPRGLIRHFMRNKTNKEGRNRWPSTPLCYMEGLQPLRSGQSRYSCGCYDAIRKEVAEDGSNECKTSNGGSGSCKVCGDKVCDCAFEPRPKLCRTPTVS